MLLTRGEISNNGQKLSSLDTGWASEYIVLDYKMPGKDGMEVAREILDLNLDQRIIFAYVMFKRR
jgi:CheY-like chemotaxis protein